MDRIGDILLADLSEYLMKNNRNTSAICAFMLGLCNASWKTLDTAELTWKQIRNEEEELLYVLPEIRMSFKPECE